MNWESEIKGYIAYLQLERSLSQNSIASYQRDVNQFADFICYEKGKPVQNVTLDDFNAFLTQLNECDVAEASQARWISGIRSFFRYLRLEQIIDSNPADLLEMPKLQRKLPDTLSHEEIQLMLDSIDRSQAAGHRNVAIIQMLYGCGLRVSELTSLTFSNFYAKEEFIRVMGKGNKERLIPIHQGIVEAIQHYDSQMRRHLDVKPKFGDHIFLSVRGNALSRIMVYNIVKKCAADAGITKSVSPHTLRHSFATELISNGANLRAVQDMLGHASIITTEIYTHLDQKHLSDTLKNYHPLYHVDN